jgi:hypothetical protein
MGLTIKVDARGRNGSRADQEPAAAGVASHIRPEKASVQEC